MADTKPNQSINISGSSVSGNQIAQSAGDQTLSQWNLQNSPVQVMSQKQVISVLEEIEKALQHSNLPQAQQKTAMRCLEATKEEAESEKPDKKHAAANLEKLAGVLKGTNESLEASQGIWTKVQPLFTQLLPWIGKAAGFFL
jgi:hypothetical protein